MLTDETWAQYERDGYLPLGRVLEGSELGALQARLDDIMLGRAPVDYDRLLMQLDSETGKYEDAGPMTLGFKGPTLGYRKVDGLERDPVFLAYLQRPLFRALCARTYGTGRAISCYRAMFMNKPAGRGTLLPWHQDRWVHLDRDPLITVWTALDPATRENGCLQVIPGSHRKGVINPSHPWAFLTEEQMLEHCRQSDVLHLSLEPGEAVLLHNWLLHRSDRNRTDVSRRAFSVCYMDAATRIVPGTVVPAAYTEYTTAF